MIQKSNIDFLKELKKNNNKVWFDSNRNRYESARDSFLEVVGTMLKSMAKLDPELSNLTAKECVFRINRDVRFSKDKQPYKNNMAAYFNKAGKKGTGAGYYVHIEPGHSFLAAGIWMPSPADLSKIRQEIDYNFDEWKKMMSTTAIKNQFEKGIDKTNTLIRPPKGYLETDPAIEFIKLKNFVVTKPLSDADIMDKDFITELSKAFKTVKPFIDFINRSLD